MAALLVHLFPSLKPQWAGTITDTIDSVSKCVCRVRGKNKVMTGCCAAVCPLWIIFTYTEFYEEFFWICVHVHWWQHAEYKPELPVFIYLHIYIYIYIYQCFIDKI